MKVTSFRGGVVSSVLMAYNSVQKARILAFSIAQIGRRYLLAYQVSDSQELFHELLV